jgi:hypothetical protein
MQYANVNCILKQKGEKGTRFIFENAVRLVAKLQTTIVQANELCNFRVCRSAHLNTFN